MMQTEAESQNERIILILYDAYDKWKYEEWGFGVRFRLVKRQSRPQAYEDRKTSLPQTLQDMRQ